MDPPQKPQSALFEVYLRLRPPPSAGQLFPMATLSPDRFLTVEEAEHQDLPTHITLNPPNDNRRRAVEKFAFTKVFEEPSTQLDIFQGTGVLPLVEGVLGPNGGEGRDGLLATLGVTGSGKVSYLIRVRYLWKADREVPYDFRIQKSTRFDPACSRCTLPIHIDEHPRPIHESLSARYNCSGGPIRSTGHVRIYVPRHDVRRPISPSKSSVEGCNSNGNTITIPRNRAPFLLSRSLSKAIGAGYR
jgi:hypothetical protein